MQEFITDSLLGSPDPLAGPWGDARGTPFRSPSRPTRALKATPKRALAKGNSNIHLQDFYLTAPSASASRAVSPVHAIAQAENLSSPWKIRVTVEAKKDEEDNRWRVHKPSSSKSPSKRPATSKSPSKGPAQRTITTTVPLKGPDDSPPQPKKGRGRPRKSLTPAKKTGTPKPRTTDRRRTEQDARSEKQTPTKRSPRKQQESVQADGLESTAGRTPALRKGRRTIREATPGKDVDEMEWSDHSSIAQPASSSPSPQKRAAPSGMGRSFRKSPSALYKDQVGGQRNAVFQDPTDEHDEFDSIIESEGFTMVSLSSLPSAQQLRSLSQPQSYEQDRPMHGEALITSKPPKSQTSGLPSTKMHRTTNAAYEFPEPVGMTQQFTVSNEHISKRAGATPSFLADSMRLYPVIKTRTPSQLYSSPALPPPPQPPLLAHEEPVDEIRHDCEPVQRETAEQVIREIKESGINEGVENLNPDPAAPRWTLDTELGSSHDSFIGFGSRTRRELGTGLRLGEELARRHELAEQAAAVVNGELRQFPRDQASLSRTVLPTPEGGSDAASVLVASQSVVYPQLPKSQLPSPETSEEDAHKEDDRMGWETVTHTKSTSKPSQAVLRATGQMERRWQTEREAVSQQAEEASSSKVIVINSDDATHYHDEGYENDSLEEEPIMSGAAGETIDVWQSEAQSSFVRNASTENSKAQFTPVLIKARRVKLPPPWQPQNSDKFAYSEEPLASDEDIFCQLGKHPRSPMTPQSRKRAKYDTFGDPALSRLSGQRLPSPDSPCNGTPSRSLQRREVTSDDADSQDGNDELDYAREYKEVESRLPSQDHPRANLPHLSPSLKPTPPASSPSHALRTTSAWLTSLVPTWLSTPKAHVSETPTAAATPSPDISSDNVHLTPQPSRTLTFYDPCSPPPAPSSSNNVSRLPTQLPFTKPHYESLRPLYRAAKSDRSLFPYNPASRSAHLLGMEVESMGWKKKIEAWELGVVDAFLDKLRGGRDVGAGADGNGNRYGTGPGLIDEAEVAKRVFSLWAGEVQKGVAGLGAGTPGLFDRRFARRREEVLRRAKWL